MTDWEARVAHPAKEYLINLVVSMITIQDIFQMGVVVQWLVVTGSMRFPLMDPTSGTCQVTCLMHYSNESIKKKGKQGIHVVCLMQW